MIASIIWENIREYLNMPSIRIVLILICSFIVLLLARFLSKKVIFYAERIEGENKREKEVRIKTLVKVLKNVIAIAVLLLVIFLILTELKVNIGPLLAGAGIVGLAIGFGAQSLVRDFFSGFFMLMENQYRVGDVIKIGDLAGIVEKFTMRITVIRDLDGVAHFIPNGEIKAVSNMTYGWSRAKLDIGVAYKEDVDRVIKVLHDLGIELKMDEKFGPFLLEEPQVLGVEEFGESQVTIRIIVKTKPIKQWDVMREFRRRIKNRFDKEGIEIPFPHRTIYQKLKEPEGSSGG